MVSDVMHRTLEVYVVLLVCIFKAFQVVLFSAALFSTGVQRAGSRTYVERD